MKAHYQRENTTHEMEDTNMKVIEFQIGKMKSDVGPKRITAIGKEITRKYQNSRKLRK